ncbi:phosphotransferase [Paenibacillus dakarensis]|uniref:phosphotransferase n=1 Tax=Paenibacillus dakarensis TaxID=1527293 RepID=UPI0006D5396F|nr:phosphotransferase [Paenibacillus dakarensis]
MAYLFRKEIYNWSSWGAVYQSIEDFRPLIQEIFTREQLVGAEHISHLTPGTNAVFKAGNYVIKIFAPSESGLDTDRDYLAERKSMSRAILQGIHTPCIAAAGTFEDKYEFKYIIMDYIEGRSAGNVISEYTLEQKCYFVEQLTLNLAKLNIVHGEETSCEVIRERVIHNDRWNIVSLNVRRQMADFLNLYEIQNCVYVHGDLTGDNVLIDSIGKMFIIDFADSTIAPGEYEFPPIIFELFHSDAQAVQEFINGMNMQYNEFVDRLFAGILLHEFGANFVKSIYEKYTGREIGSLSDIYEIKRLIHTHLVPDPLIT